MYMPLYSLETGSLDGCGGQDAAGPQQAGATARASPALIWRPWRQYCDASISGKTYITVTSQCRLEGPFAYPPHRAKEFRSRKSQRRPRWIEFSIFVFSHDTAFIMIAHQTSQSLAIGSRRYGGWNRRPPLVLHRHFGQVRGQLPGWEPITATYVSFTSNVINRQA
jgi:hypothetical protein